MKDNSSQQTRSAIQNQLQRRRDSVDLEKKKKPAGIIEALSRQGPIKKAFRHWRSPSNPLDWSRSAWSVNTALIGADEEEASQPTITKETRNYSTMCMTKVSSNVINRTILIVSIQFHFSRNLFFLSQMLLIRIIKIMTTFYQ